LRAKASSAAGEILTAVAQTPAWQALRQRAEQGGLLTCADVAAAAQPFLAASLHLAFPRRTIVVVTAGTKAQEQFIADLATWSQPGSEGPQLSFFPAWEAPPHEAKLPSLDVIGDRLETLTSLLRNAGAEPKAAPVVVASVTALLQRTFAPARLRSRLRVLRRGERIDLLDLVEWLEDQAYEPEAQVTQRGELALRGGILDVFPLSSPWPVRLEFVGNELESLRYFDPLTQISRAEVDEVVLPPAGELGLLKRELAAGAAANALAPLLDYLPSEAVVVLCEPDELVAQAGQYRESVPAADPFYIGWEDWRRDAAARGLTLLTLREAPEPAPDGEDSARREAPAGLRFSSLDLFRPLGERAPEAPVAEVQRREFFAQLHRWLRQDYAVHVFCNNDGERQRFTEIWQELGLAEEHAGGSGAPAGMAAPPPPAGLSINLGSLARGFLCEDARLVVVTDAEVFGRYKAHRPRRLKSPHATGARSALDINFAELEEGDYVVHLQYGIGRFLGLKNLPTTAGAAKSEIRNPKSEIECLAIEYAPRDPGQPAPKLYVPLTEAHLVSKYVGAGKARPPLNTLGGTRWAKAKAHAAVAVRDLAADLLEIQAARAAQPGFAFPADAPWQREFDSAFVFEETPDQFRAIEATKRDLEQPKPMDRLICGDVGFGKTEVAIRAAFKVVLAGKQVAVLVPTTVLAQQHFNTFRERMADYPVCVELLSRFRTRGQQEQVIADLAAGKVDIVIGTHRLVQPDVAFKDLGLVVIDEEQRFGVGHKETLKQLRKLVDVLTLSATPIPRTLYLALTGARDLSAIETPPQDRLPVETIISAYDERLIRDAIQRELARGGQVFYLHNRIFDIEAVALKLRTLLPSARIDVGHGQMHADDLEEVMTRFISGATDVLLSTTIIESGIDIPNANTIIIDRADRFGLSDLYQLRGRVGRYKHQAYAYLLIPRHAGLLADARKRIAAVKQFSRPGSGFKIALRDLEIRGAGNLLGAEQSGHIAAVGFELYCQLLQQSVAALKGEPVKPRVEVFVRFDFLEFGPGSETRREITPPPVRRESRAPLKIAVPREVATFVTASPKGDSEFEVRSSDFLRGSAALPLNYVPEPRHRIEVYRKLAQATDPATLAALRVELRDRFGTLPPAAERLFQVTAIKLLAAERGVTAIETRGDKLMLTRGGDFIQIGGRFPRLRKRDPKARLDEVRKLLLAL
jgi:transcription-repair coupling factor (superfamily II helicase)